MALQDGAWESVGLLQIDAPVLQFVEWNTSIGNSATDIGSWRNHPEIAVKVLHTRFALTGLTELIQHCFSPGVRGHDDFESNQSKIMNVRATLSYAVFGGIKDGFSFLF